MIRNVFKNIFRNSKSIFNNRNNLIICENIINNKKISFENSLISSYQRKYFTEKNIKDDLKIDNDNTSKVEKKENEEKINLNPEKEKIVKLDEKKQMNKDNNDKTVSKENAEKTIEKKEIKENLPTEKKTVDKKPETKKVEKKPIQETNEMISAFDSNKYLKLVESLNKDSNKIAEEKLINYHKKIENNLLPNQKKFVEKVAKYFSTMNLSQIRIGLNNLTIDQTKLTLNSPIRLDDSLPTRKQLVDPSNPKRQEFNVEKDLMVNLTKWYIQQNPGFGLGASSNEKNEEKAEKKEVKVEKTEKSTYDLELTSFDAAKKINLIKEVRVLTNLGLKEAKELVEKAPTTLMKAVKKQEAEDLVKKLKEIGGLITLK